ncbi:MAG TPA: glycerophosphodiester phosphodiesterase [Anaerolineales bacterium]|nr:glycerophosphodiester phosphodiesterase [Anaerolineales bacterium]
MNKKIPKYISVFILVGLMVLLTKTTAHSKPAIDRAYYDSDTTQVLVIAHKGGDGLWPGNTIYAFRHAVKLGVDAIETDTHLTRDGVIVLLHDPRVDPTTNGTGLVEDMTLAEVKQLDAAYKWTPDDGKSFPFRGKGLTIPTLAETFQEFPHTRFVLDVKQTRAPIAEPLCKLIHQYDMQNNVIVASLYDDIMRDFRNDCPEIATSASFSEVAAFVLTQRSDTAGLISPSYQALQGPYDPLGVYNSLIVTKNYVSEAHAKNLRVEPWADSVAAMKQCLADGANGIITDRPDLLLELLKRK